MKHLLTICGLMACLAICTLNPKEANARCDVLPGATPAPAWSQKGMKLVLIKNNDERVVAYIKNKAGSSLKDCYPTLMYDKSKLTCRIGTKARKLSEYEMESNHRVYCTTKGTKDHQTSIRIYALGRKVVNIRSFKTNAMLLAFLRQFAAKLKALEMRQTKTQALANKAKAKADNAMEAASDAHGTATEAKGIAIEAKKRKSAKVSVELDGFYSAVTQGLNARDKYYPGGVGLKVTYWFFETAKFKQVRLGASLGLRWHHLMLTINGAPQDSDVPAQQVDFTFGLGFRWKPLSWLSFDLGAGGMWVFFKTQDQVGNQDDDGNVEGPNGDVTQNFGLYLSGGLNFHIGQFNFGPSIMGAMIINGLYHPHYQFEGDAQRGTVMHFYAGAKAGVRF
ncbi:hypothetical protein ACFL3T_05385 [Patescibacteria group bacterium]